MTAYQYHMKIESWMSDALIPVLRHFKTVRFTWVVIKTYADHDNIFPTQLDKLSHCSMRWNRSFLLFCQHSTAPKHNFGMSGSFISGVYS